MPSIQKLYTELEGRDDILILAMNTGDDDLSVVRDYWNESGFEFDALVEEQSARGNASRAFGIIASPTNIVVGPDGKVRYATAGYDEAAIRQHLGL